MSPHIECPYCDGQAHLEREARELMYRKESFRVFAHYYKCEQCLETFTSTESDTISLTQLHNQYREKHNIPFPEEIIALREKYDLSASKMSLVLGLGANGYSNYEHGEIPTPAYGNLMIAAADPGTFLQFLEKAREHFSDQAYQKACDRVKGLIETGDEEKILCATFNVHCEPGRYTGYRKVVVARIASLVNHYLQHTNKEFNDKLKLNKLLFYTDFLHYKRQGMSITGLNYRAIQYGPVPAKYDNLYAYLQNEQLISSQFQQSNIGGAREIFCSEAAVEDHLFSDAEKDTIHTVTERFSNMSSWDMVVISHEEKAWRTQEGSRSLIAYQENAFDLKAL